MKQARADYWGFPGVSDSKESACNAGDPGLIPGLGRSPGEGNGNPLQHPCLGNPMDRGAWWATVHGLQRVRHDWVTNNFTFFHKLLRGSHNQIGFVYSDWPSCGRDLGQHLEQGTETEWKLLFFPLLAQATNPTAGTERTAASVETSISRYTVKPWRHFPRKAWPLSCLQSTAFTGVFVPKAASWFLAQPLFWGWNPLCGLSSVFMEVVALPYWIGFITTWWLFFISEALPYSLISFYISILLILCIWYIYKYKIRFTFVFLRFSLIP